MNSGPKIGIRDHLIAQKGDQRPQESTEGGEWKDMLPKVGIGSQRLVTLGSPGRYKCPVYKENVCFLERPDGEQLSMQGCMIARKVVVFNLNEKTQLICMPFGGPKGGPWGHHCILYGK